MMKAALALIPHPPRHPPTCAPPHPHPKHTLHISPRPPPLALLLSLAVTQTHTTLPGPPYEAAQTRVFSSHLFLYQQCEASDNRGPGMWAGGRAWAQGTYLWHNGLGLEGGTKATPD